MRLSVNFRGRVQGVGFRATTREVVLRRPARLTGWVRNEPDGSVQIELQGDAAAIDAALNELRSAMSRYIRSMTRIEIPETRDDGPFTIAR
ncbi:MAG: acylphosphatase [Phycisphaerales bacterium]|nr:acylphosphatase [Phycisphaerales bacterium]